MNHEQKTPVAKWNGQRISFDGEASGPVSGKRLVGIVESAEFIGYTERGQIPNYSLSVRGASGKLAVVNMVEQYALFSET